MTRLVLAGILMAACAVALAPGAAWAGATSTTTVPGGPPTVFGQTATFTAIVTGGGPTPTGAVQFKVDGTAVGSPITLTAGTASFSTNTLTVSGSPHAIEADYSGDTNYNPSTGSTTQTVNQDSTSTAVGSSSNPTVTGQATTFTATISALAPGSGTPTGSVTFSFGDGSPTATVPLSSGQASVAHSYAAIGGYSVTASYPGDSNFTTSSFTTSQNVVQAGTTTNLTSAPNPTVGGQSVTFTATVGAAAPGSGTPTGSVTFTFGDGSPPFTAPLSSGQATATHTYATTGSYTATAVYSGDANYTASSFSASQTVNTSTTATVTSSLNPSTVGQPVTFTATVASSSGTPTGSVSFKDGGTVIGTAALAGGSAAITISTLTLGNHSITAVYAGGGTFAGSTSAVLTQAVAVPADSTKLRALQIAVTKIEAQGSAAAITGAVDDAIEEGFSDTGQMITPNGSGMHVNFAAEPQEKSPAARVGDAFAALGYAGNNIYKAPPPPPAQWLAWADARGTGWNTSLSAGDIRGGQVNAVAGLTRKITPDVLIGVFGGYESFNYTSQLLAGTLKGDGWTVGGYAAWRLLPGLRFDITGARSGVDYDGVAGTAAGSFPGSRWIASTGLTGIYKTYGFDIEPSARVYGLWEHEDAYVDSLGTPQASRDFSSGRASAGTKVTYPWMYSSTMTVAPYAGIYADYYFTRDNATAILLPTEFIEGWSARVTSGVSVGFVGGAKLSVGGEVGGLGSGDFTVWSVRGRASVPF